MVFYLITAVIFFLIDFINHYCIEPAKKLFNYLSLFLFVLIAGTRFETGYDWQAYTNVYENTPSLLEVLFSHKSAILYGEMEPLFIFSNALLKSFSDNVSLLFFMAAFFNGVVIYKVTLTLKANPSFVFFIYFCIAYLTGQMTLLRQSIASSLMLIAIVAIIDSKTRKAILFGILGAGFQVSVLIFAPLILLKKYKPNIFLFTSFLIVCFIITFAIDDVVLMIMSSLLVLTSGNIAIKLLEYIEVGKFVSSTGSWLYLIINLLVLQAAYIMGIRRNWTIEFRIYFYSTLLMIFGLTILATQPIFWNRIQLVVVPLQGILLFKFSQTLSAYKKIFFLILIYTICIVIFVYSLNKDNMSPFIPYQSIIEHTYSDYRGDGAYRLESTAK
jgi:EpsG family